MKKTMSMMATALMLTGLTACNEAKIEDNARLYHIEAQTAAFGTPATKTQVGSMSGDQLLIDWTPGDQIGVVSSTSSIHCFTNIEEESGANGNFTGLLAGSPVQAFYPYVEGVTDLTAVPFCIPTNQIYSGPESIGQYDVRVANIMGRAAYGFRMNFTSLTCLLRFEVDLSGLVAYTEQDESEDADPTNPTYIGDKEAISFAAGEKVVALNMTIESEKGAKSTWSSDEAFYTVDLTSGTPELRESDEYAGEYNNSLVLLMDEDTDIRVAGSNTAVFYAVAAPGAVSGTMMEINITSSIGNVEHWTCFRVPLAVDLVAGHYYTVPIKTSALEGVNVLCATFVYEDEEEGGEE